MIERMKFVQIVASAGSKDTLLEKVREMGVLHLAEKKSADGASLERFSELSRISMALKDYTPEKAVQHAEILDEKAFAQLHENAVNAFERKKELEAERSAALLSADKLRGWGDFDPADVAFLRKNGYDIRFYRMGKKELALLQSGETPFIMLSPVEQSPAVATIGPLEKDFPATEFEMPAEGLSALHKRAAECEKGILECDKTLAEASLEQASYQAYLLKAQNAMELSSADRSAEGEDGLVWLSGYIPEANMPELQAAARENSWAYAADDPAEDDELVPTKVKYNKVTGLMRPVFDILGTVPGYREYDISFWFLCFFALFTAMIIGDAGYGVLFLILGIALHAKTKKASDIVLLLYVLSVATIAWGAVTGTWFGLEGAMKVPFLKALVIPGIANYPEYFGVSTTDQQNNVMKFCFIIGTLQLSLACVMNVKTKLPKKDLSLVADIGWLIAICALYVLVLYLVIGEQVSLTGPAICVALGFVLVVMFGGMAPGKSFSEGLKEGLGGAFTTFLNTISAFGNVMSYIRLFAVGMASLAIAQSFNNMAAGFSGVLVIVGALIMVIGHALNVVMGLLSVVVHGVRLNLLEFSGQLNMEWSGKAYDPFRKLNKIKK